MSGMSAKPVSARVLDAAIAWQLCLDAGSPEERAEFERWHAADEEHARAWMQLGMLNQRFAAAAGPVRKALGQSRAGLRQRVRTLGSGLASLVLVGGLLGWLGAQQHLGYWLADQRTGTGEQRTLRLQDGTLISLNTHSAVDVRFDATQRLIVLHEGEISIETGHKDDRPFIVATADGRLRALGTRFSVALAERGAQVWVQSSRVEASVPGTAPLTLRAGQGAWLDGRQARPLDPTHARAAAWEDGVLEVHDRALGDVIDALRAYRRGWLHITDDAAALRVSGVFPLDDSEQALRSLQEVLPVRVEQHLGWWTRLSLRER